MRLVIVRGPEPNYTVMGESQLEPTASGFNASSRGFRGGRRPACGFGPRAMPLGQDTESVRFCINCYGGPGAPLTADDLLTDLRLNVFAYVDADADRHPPIDGAMSPRTTASDFPTRPRRTPTATARATTATSTTTTTRARFRGRVPARRQRIADFDGDGQGDTADLDDDNDGVSDIAEALAGSDPRNAQSIPGLTSGPVPAGAGQPAEGARPALASARRRHHIQAALQGSDCVRHHGAPARLDFELRVTPRRPQVARFELLLASRSLGLGSGRRSVRLKPVRRLRRPSRRFKLQLRVTATDEGGNRAVKTRTITVR